MVPAPDFAPIPDPGWVRRAAEGEPEAAEELVARLRPLLLKIVRSHLPRRTAVEDLCQTVFVKIFHHLRSYSGRVPLEHWASRIAVNTCLNELKAERLRPEVRLADLREEEQALVESLHAAEAAPAPGTDIAARDLLGRLLASLKPEERLVLNLMYLEGHTVAETAALTGWSRPLVKIRAFRARSKLKTRLSHLLA